MGGSEAMHLSSVSRATAGQVTWFWLNRLIDLDERERRVHLRCLPSWKEIRCEVCGEPVDLLRDYASELAGKVYSPREYIEHQLHMSDEEKAARTVFFTELFAKHEREKEQRGYELQTTSG
jgi:hypothetical protein